MSTPSPSFSTLHSRALTAARRRSPLLPPSHSTDSALTAAIASAQLHPTLEASLHVLNCDLPSAHFLVRHMQSAPAHEGMLLHGILHRIEGDFDNARAWYADVEGSAVFAAVWGGDGRATADEGGEAPGRDGGGKKAPRSAAAKGFIDAVERLKKDGVGELEALERESLREIEEVVRFCVGKFGDGRWEDASDAWVRPSQEIKSVGADMVSGDKGMRSF